VTLLALLKNVLYLGKLTCGGECYDGEHPAIVDAETFRRVQAMLCRNRQAGGAEVRNGFGALLKGLLRCVPCGCSMVHTFTTRKPNKRYRYYVCLHAQKRGWHTCPSKAIPAREIEQFVIDQVRAIGRDQNLVAETIREAQVLGSKKTEDLKAEQKALERQLERDSSALRELVKQVARDPRAADEMADLQYRIRTAEQRATQVREELIALGRDLLDENETARVLKLFDPIWDSLAPREQARVIRLVVEQVNYDGRTGTVSITFHQTGIRTLAEGLKDECA